MHRHDPVIAWVAGLVLLGVLARGPAPAGADEPATAPEPLPLRLALQWLPQSQFAGFYMARDKGFFRDAGLDVTLIHTGPGPSSLDFLIDGRADFATLFLADAIVHARQTVPLVQVAQLVQRSNLLLVAWKDQGIERPADLDGQRVSYWPGAFSAAFTAFFRRHGVQPEALPQNYTVHLFLQRGVAACSAMRYNEYNRIFQAGVDPEELTVFMMRDDGLGFPEDGIYTSEAWIERHPQACRALREAVLAGWNYARRHPDEAIDTVLRESRNHGVPANRPHARWMLEHLLASIFPADGEWIPGRLDPAAYRASAAALTAAGLLAVPLPFGVFAPLEQETP